MHSPHSHRKSGFTLVELLTVIAIIGILAAILLPVLGRVRDSAQSARCTSKLRQMGPAFMAFATDHKNKYPLGWTGNTADGYRNNWYCHLIPYLGRPEVSDWPDIKAACDPKGPLGCPTVPTGAGSNWISYKMSNKHGDYLKNKLGQPLVQPTGLPLAEVQTPSQSLLVADGRAGNPIFKSWDPAEFDGVTYPHRDRLNALFADGHVTSFNEQQLKERWATIYTKSVGN